MGNVNVGLMIVFSAQVGDGTNTDRYTHVVVSGASSGNVAIAVGDVSKMFSCDCCVTAA